eukprot:scaffold332_cov117-Cylindrotheca_fusiformis.AAC.28
MFGWLKQCLFVACVLLAQVAESRMGGIEVVRTLQKEERQVVYLLPFDIKIALEGSTSSGNVDIVALKQIVEDWLSASFQVKSENEGLSDNGAVFDYILLEIADQRDLQEASSLDFYKAAFRAFSVWNLASPDTEPVSDDLVDLIQRTIFLEDKDKLLELIRQADGADSGLGSAVLEIRLGVLGDGSMGEDEGDADEGTNRDVQIIIAVAIVVASLTFCLVICAVVWNWRTDSACRDANKDDDNISCSLPDSVASPKKTPDSSCNSDTPVKPPPLSPPSKPAKLPDDIRSQVSHTDTVVSTMFAPIVALYIKACKALEPLSCTSYAPPRQ